MTKKPSKKAEKVWKYLLKNTLATPTQVAKATGVSYGYAHKLMSKTSTPREVFEAEAKTKADNTKARVVFKVENAKSKAKFKKVPATFDEAIVKAPIRDPFIGGLSGNKRFVQVVGFIVVACIIALLLYLTWV